MSAIQPSQTANIIHAATEDGRRTIASEEYRRLLKDSPLAKVKLLRGIGKLEFAGQTLERMRGVIIYYSPSNAYWEKLSDEYPVCFSRDAITPSGLSSKLQSPGCVNCKQNQFSKNPDGTIAGKPCKNTYRLFIVPETSVELTSFTVPPTSMKLFRREFLVNIRARFGRYSTSLIDVIPYVGDTRTRKGISFVKFDIVRALAVEEISTVELYKALIPTDADAVVPTKEEAESDVTEPKTETTPTEDIPQTANENPFPTDAL